MVALADLGAKVKERVGSAFRGAGRSARKWTKWTVRNVRNAFLPDGRRGAGLDGVKERGEDRHFLGV